MTAPIQSGRTTPPTRVKSIIQMWSGRLARRTRPREPCTTGSSGGRGRRLRIRWTLLRDAFTPRRASCPAMRRVPQLRPLGLQSVHEVVDQVGEPAERRQEMRVLPAHHAVPVQDRLRRDDEDLGSLLDREPVAGRVPEDVQALVATVVGAAAAGDAEEAGPQQSALRLEAGDALLQQRDLPGERAAPTDTRSPAVVGARDGRGDEEQGLVHRRNLRRTAETRPDVA